MRKSGLLVLAFVVAGLIPSGGHAASTACNSTSTDSISAIDGAPETYSCTFKARGPETYWVMSPNTWTFKIKHGSTTRTVTGGPSTPTGTLNSVTGDQITYTVTSTCQQSVCVLSSFVEIGATPADWFDHP